MWGDQHRCLPGKSEKQKLRRSDFLQLSSKEPEFSFLKRHLGAARGQEQDGASVKFSSSSLGIIPSHFLQDRAVLGVG